MHTNYVAAVINYSLFHFRHSFHLFALSCASSYFTTQIANVTATVSSVLILPTRRVQKGWKTHAGAMRNDRVLVYGQREQKKKKLFLISEGFEPSPLSRLAITEHLKLAP